MAVELWRQFNDIGANDKQKLNIYCMYKLSEYRNGQPSVGDMTKADMIMRM